MNRNEVVQPIGHNSDRFYVTRRDRMNEGSSSSSASSDSLYGAVSSFFPKDNYPLNASFENMLGIRNFGSEAGSVYSTIYSSGPSSNGQEPFSANAFNANDSITLMDNLMPMANDLVNNILSSICPEEEEEEENMIEGASSLDTSPTTTSPLSDYRNSSGDLKLDLEGSNLNLVKVCVQCKSRVATYNCNQCIHHFCDNCTKGHLESGLTKDHCVVRIDNLLKNDGNAQRTFNLDNHFTSTSGVQRSYCESHDERPVQDYCKSCKKGTCQECTFAEHVGHVVVPYQSAVDNAVNVLNQALEEAKNRVNVVERTIKSTCGMVDNINKRSKEVSSEINTCFHRLMSACEVRRKKLLSQKEAYENVKIQTLSTQVDAMTNNVNNTNKAMIKMQNILDNGSDVQILKSTEVLLPSFRKLIQCDNILHPRDNGKICFGIQNSTFHLGISNYGGFECGVYGPNCEAYLDGISRAVPGVTACFYVRAKDHLGKLIHSGGDLVKVAIMTENGGKIFAQVIDHGDGTYCVFYRSVVEGLHLIYVTVRDLHIKGSPFQVLSYKGRDYVSLANAVCCRTFGGDGGGQGQLCRPWGVSCDREGRIVVADRSNNRIQIFSCDGRFLKAFGSTGNQNGQFERPAGIAVDCWNRIVVADKDNHRIQIFRMDGTFVRAFGEKGAKPGSFNYPWDVATNSMAQILVSDTRNHRVQLFTSCGQFINSYGASNLKEFDSPRGVAFDKDDNVYITDFNNHRIVCLDGRLGYQRIIGSEGSINGKFSRPQGIAVDNQGNVVVADSKNHRIQVLNSRGAFVCSFGGPGNGDSQMDRPSGLCLSPDGKIIVVDFGNNRVQIF